MLTFDEIKKLSRRKRLKTIDNLVSEMIQAGVQTKHFYEILEGMNGTNV